MGTLDLTREEVIFAPITFHAIVTFWAETGRSFMFMLRATRPDGEPLNGMEQPVSVDLKGGDGGGYTINLKSLVPGFLPGLYWFEFLVDGDLVTKLPMVILHGKESPELTYPMQPEN
jgi:hypothetical protein